MITKQPVLVMIQGPEPGSFYKLPDNRVTTIGRSSRNTIRAVSNSVSRFHSEIAWINGRWELTDLNSKKGTIVNGLRIDDKHTLRPGDIVRLSTTVFRFDLIEETKLRDGAMMAIVEAEMDVQFAPKGEGAASLDDIRARSRLEVRDWRRRQPSDRSLRPNLLFLAGLAASVALAVAALLFFAHRHAKAAALHAEARATALYGQAVAAAEAGDPAAAADALRDLKRQFPHTPTAARAEETRAEIVWASAERTLALAAAQEAEGNHAAALQAYDQAEALDPDPALQDVIRRNREYAVRLAHARFEATERVADRDIQAGRREAALAAYQEARERIGVPELVAKADERIHELQSAD